MTEALERIIKNNWVGLLGIIVPMSAVIIYFTGIDKTLSAVEKQQMNLSMATRKQNELLTEILFSLRQKNRDHSDLKLQQTETMEMMHNSIRVMDKIMLILERTK